MHWTEQSPERQPSPLAIKAEEVQPEDVKMEDAQGAVETEEAADAGKAAVSGDQQ